MFSGRLKRAWRGGWPWLILAAMVGVAVWHVVDFSESTDTEFPRVVRPFFNSLPPAAYRLAEPGDTLDRIGLYLAAGASALAFLAIFRRARSKQSVGLWPTAMALGLTATWHASTPSPTFDGWHGLGWRVIFDPSAPFGLRLTMTALVECLAAVFVVNIGPKWSSLGDWMARARDLRIRGLLAAAAVLVVLRQVEIPGVEPVGYWPRVVFDMGVMAFGLALIRCRPLEGTRPLSRPTLALVATWGVLVAMGVSVAIYHRPLSRLHAVVPGKIYISAMPFNRGLAIEQSRIHFRTIINLFDESSTQASPYHEDEIRFVREHGLGYLGSPSDGMESDRFLAETLTMAQDPAAWPILVHCHGCMDRSPAWMGIYRFVVEGKPLAEVFREIERHRGSRPKAIVTLQYNRKLPRFAPDHFATDPTAQLLARCLEGTRDPFLRPGWNPTATGRRVVTRIEHDPSVWRH